MNEDIKFSAYWEVTAEENVNKIEDIELKTQLKEMSIKSKDRYEAAIRQANMNYQQELVSISRLAKVNKG